MARRRRSRGVWFPNLGTSSGDPKTSTTTTTGSILPVHHALRPQRRRIRNTTNHTPTHLLTAFRKMKQMKSTQVSRTSSGPSTSSDESSETSSSPETPPSTKEQPTPQSESDAASSSPDRPMSGRAETAPSARRRLLKAEKTTQSSARVPSESRGFGAKRGY